jgi:flagellar biosynthesis/type III secretory pathway protein FliH
MTRTLVLQDFSTPGVFAQPSMDLAPVPPAPDAESDALETFDAGYKSGWADCANAEAEERRAVGAGLSTAVADAKLTQDAARRDVLAALGPLFDEVVSTLLPSIAAEAVVPTVLAELSALAEGQTIPRVEIHAAPNLCQTLERIVETESVADLVIKPEPAFGEGQVSIRTGTERRDLDMAAATARIAAAIAEFSAQSTSHSTQHQAQGAA